MEIGFAVLMVVLAMLAVVGMVMKSRGMGCVVSCLGFTLILIVCLYMNHVVR